MSLSRLRLRLAAGFALAFALALGLLAAGSLGYLWNKSNRRLSRHLGRVARDVAAATEFELNEAPGRTLHEAALEAKAEWPLNRDVWGVIDDQGRVVASRDSANLLDRVLSAPPSGRVVDRFGVERPSPDMRAVRRAFVLPRDDGGKWRFGVVAVGSIEGIEADTEALVTASAIATPLILLLSLAAGYVLSRRALRPVDLLRDAIAGIGPTDLGRRLPLRAPADEIDALALQFNALLGRLEDAQRRNRAFVREAAHQIRTPLTLVLGEADADLQDGDPSRAAAGLGRIRAAAEQMRRRVDELFLLAEAQAGATVRLEDDVELDGLVLEATELMRSRAATLGRSLAIGGAEPVIVRGNEPLLKEAVLELLENGCRHGSAAQPVRVSAFSEGDHGVIEVESAGDAFERPSAGEEWAEGGIGLAIVEWIARSHGGSLRVTRRGESNLLALLLPTREGAPPSS